jgi:hypothetical protein
VAQLARRILWSSEATGLQRFYLECPTLPTGLWGEHRALTCLPDIRHFADGALDRESVFNAVSCWQKFKKRVPVGSACSASRVQTLLSRLNVNLAGQENIHLATVVEWELKNGETKRADAVLASQLGQLITPEFMTGLEKGKPEEREEAEHSRLSELLQEVLFQAEDGSWHKPTLLVVAENEEKREKDEAMRAAFAPQNFRLHVSYSGNALEFFFAARPRLEVGLDYLVLWVLNAASQSTQTAALRYLLNGEMKNALAERIRENRDEEKWLWRLGEYTWLKVEFNDNERFEIETHILRLRDEQLREPTVIPLLPLPSLPPKHVWTVEELWKWWEQERKPMAEYTLEGEKNWPLFHGGQIHDEEMRRAELTRLLRSKEPAERNPLWYRLFGYACLVSAGRHTTELRDFWTLRLGPERFWERTSAEKFSDETQEIFEHAVTAPFTNFSAGGEAAYFWRRIFYDIRKIHRMVWDNDFPAVLMELVDQGHGQHLRQFLSTGQLPGPGQPRWVGTFGQSADRPLSFIIRELVRLEVITDKSVLPLAFFSCRPVLRALFKIGWIPDEETAFSGEDWLAKLDGDPVHRPLLLPCYDIPLLHMGVTHRGGRMPVLPN